MSIELYNVNDEGELEQLAISGLVKDMLNSEMVVLLVDDPQKAIYLWKGSNARVRKKFIAARLSQDLRGKKGLSYKVDSIDHGSEPPAFINLVGGPISMSEAPSTEAIAPPVTKKTEPSPASPVAIKPPSPKEVAIKPPSPKGVMIKPPSPTIRPPPEEPSIDFSEEPTILSPSPSISTQSGIQTPPGIEDGVKAIINEIEKLPPPPPYTREIVFIGPYAFTVAERKYEIASPPEGQFLAKGYVPRAIIRSGKVLAVELLKGGPSEAAADTQIQTFKIKFQK